MGVLNRFFLFIFALLMLLLVLIIGAIALRLVPAYLWHNEMMYLLGRQETLYALGIVLLLSLHFLCTAVFTRSKQPSKEVILVKTQSGTAAVSNAAVIDLLVKSVKMIPSVNDATVKLTNNRRKDNQEIKAAVNLTVDASANVGVVSEAVYRCVNQRMTDNIGITDADIKVNVTKMTKNTAHKRVV